MLIYINRLNIREEFRHVKAAIKFEKKDEKKINKKEDYKDLRSLINNNKNRNTDKDKEDKEIKNKDNNII